MNSRHWVSILAGASAFAGFLLGGLPAGFAAEEKSADRIVELPAVVVTDSRELPPPESWRFAEIPGFEILANASDRETQKLLREFQLFNIAVDVVWKGLQEKRAVPIALIICGKDGKFDAFLPKGANDGDNGRASLFLQNREQAAIVLDFEAKTMAPTALARDALVAETAAAAAAAATAGIEAETDATGSPGGGRIEIDHNRQLYREYLRFLMSRVQPRLPVWFEEGLAQLFMGMKFDRQMITFARLEDPSTRPVTGGTAEGDFNAALQGRTFIPLQEFFSVERDSTVAASPIGNPWAKQAQAFVHLCLFGENQKYQKGFVAFLLRLQKEPPSEDLFRECFNMSYKNMLTILAGYRDFAVFKSFEWRLPRGQTIPEPAPLALRDATPAEVGRIKGDALRLAGNPAAAHGALIAPYLRGDRDPQLLAALGLEELAAGRDDRAEKFLAAAVEGKVGRPRAYLELARLRSKAHLAKPAGSEGRLNAAQTREVIAPLLAGRSQPPPLPEIYELMADTLVRSAEPPPRDALNVLFEGANLFPARLGIAYQTAVLCVRAGEIKGATGLVDRALLIATDPKIKGLFVDLKNSLPPSSPAAPAATKR